MICTSLTFIYNILQETDCVCWLMLRAFSPRPDTRTISNCQRHQHQRKVGTAEHSQIPLQHGNRHDTDTRDIDGCLCDVSTALIDVPLPLTLSLTFFSKFFSPATLTQIHPSFRSCVGTLYDSDGTAEMTTSDMLRALANVQSSGSCETIWWALKCDAADADGRLENSTIARNRSADLWRKEKSKKLTVDVDGKDSSSVVCQ